jgi:hypothetical protein
MTKQNERSPRLQEWYDIASRGTSGDMVYGILRDWEQDLKSYSAGLADGERKAAEEILKEIYDVTKWFDDAQWDMHDIEDFQTMIDKLDKKYLPKPEQEKT